jgi:DNA mismatch repair protein MutS
VLAGFARCETSAFIVASHIAELAGGIDQLAGTRFLHFDAEVRDGELVFGYRVREGVSEQRLGMLILEREGVLGRLSRLAPPAVPVNAAANPPMMVRQDVGQSTPAYPIR